MNTRQMQYAILLSKIRNFSQVAEELNISQPALSKQILALEKELGVRLFDRDTTPVTMTAAGEHFVREAQALLHTEDQLVKSMQRYRTGEDGRLVIGVSPFRSLYLTPGLVKKIKKKYPGIQICLHEPPSDQIRKEAAEGKYDFAIVNLPVDETVLDVLPMEPETLVLVVPENLEERLPEVHDGTVSIENCAKLPFVTVGKTQELRKLFDQICAKADIRPNITVEVTGLATVWAMVQAGVGAALLPLQLVKETADHTGIKWLMLKEKTSIRQPVVVTRRGQYLSDCAKYAISLLTDQN